MVKMSTGINTLIVVLILGKYFLYGQSQSLSTTDTINTPEPAAESEVTSESEVATEVTSAPEADSEVTSYPEAESESTSEPEAGFEITTELETESEVASEPEVASEVTSEPETQSEVTAEPEADSETTSEPELELEVTSEPEAESEVTSEPEAESAVTSEPEAESEVTSEPEADSEVTSEPEAESEVTSEPEAESEITSEPEAESEVTSNPEVESELTSEPEADSGVTSEPEAESEVTSEPEAESEATSEPKAESEVTSDPEAGPEVTSDPEAVSEVTSEPEAESEVTSEPEAESEVTSEPEAEPEVTSEPEAESEVTFEPEAESEATSEPEAESEATSEPEAESEVTSEPETESEVTSEPEAESEVTSEPEAESEITSEPEVESEVTPETESGATVESEAEPEVTSEPEAESEVTSEPEATAEMASAEPTAAEIMLPPFALIFIVVSAMIGLYLYSNCGKHPEAIVVKRRRNSDLNIICLEDYNDVLKTDEPPFLSPFDIEVIECFHMHHNRPMDLLKIAFPALLSLGLCPLTLYMYSPLTTFIWPKDQYPNAPDINDAIACFLAPAGLVYATSFGFAFQQALTKQSHIMDKVTTEISMIDQIATFCTRINLPHAKLRRQIYRYIKSETIFMILQILNRSPNSFHEKPGENVKIKIWSVIDVLREVNTDVNDSKTQIDRVLCEKIIEHIMQLNSICSDRLGVLHTKFTLWAFLETLGFFSFVGILLLKAFSYRMELVMCIITVFSISMLCFVVSDLDSPFSGFFRVDLSVLLDVIKRIDSLFTDSKNEESKSSTETSSLSDSMYDSGMHS